MNQGLKDNQDYVFFGWVGTYPRATLLTAPGSEGYGSRLVSVVPGVCFFF